MKELIEIMVKLAVSRGDNEKEAKKEAEEFVKDCPEVFELVTAYHEMKMKKYFPPGNCNGQRWHDYLYFNGTWIKAKGKETKVSG